MAHLHTLVGGRITTLRPMLEHYIALGVQSVSVNVHLTSPNDPLIEEVREITDSIGVPIASVLVGDLQSIVPGVHEQSRMRYPNDWHIIADQDELQIYPAPLRSVEELCDGQGYDYVSGCFLDRLAADGTMASLDPYQGIWQQYPIAAFLTFPLLGGCPRKVVLMKAQVKLLKGQHMALTGCGCPLSKCFVQVHHFKWVKGLVEWLKFRLDILRNQNASHKTESSRFLRYLVEHSGKVDLTDRRFMASLCRSEYPHWELVRLWLLLSDIEVGLRECVAIGPDQIETYWNRVIALGSQLTEAVTRLCPEAPSFRSVLKDLPERDTYEMF